MKITPLIPILKEKIGASIQDYSILGEGQCNTIYKLETDSGNYCLKIEKDEKPFAELNHISTEGALLNLLKQNPGIAKHIPRLIFSDEHYYVYEYIDGTPMKEAFQKMNTAEQEAACKYIAQFHAALGDFEKQEVLNLGITEYNPNAHKLNPTQHDLSMLPQQHHSLVEHAYRMYQQTLSLSSPQLLHNDAHPESIFTDNGAVTFIDFGDMIWRDVHYEFYHYVMRFPDHWRLIVNHYEKLSGKKLHAQRIVAIALLRYLGGLLHEIQNGDKTFAYEKFEHMSRIISC